MAQWLRLWRWLPVPSPAGPRTAPLLFLPSLHRSARAHKVEQSTRQPPPSCRTACPYYRGDGGSLPPAVRVPSEKQPVQKFRPLSNERLHPPKSRGQVEEGPTRANSSGKAAPQRGRRLPSRDRTKQECSAALP